MAGTAEGGKQAAQTNKEKYGPDFYSKIGSAGGQKGKTGGFGAGEAGRKLARKAGKIGGTLSRRGYKLSDQDRKIALLRLKAREA